MSNKLIQSFLNRTDINVKIFSNKDVKIDRNAIDELESLFEVNKTIKNIQSEEPDFFDISDPCVSEVSVTPDFHKGSGIPIGSVILTKGCLIPQAIGNDVNCGMRAYITNLTEEQLKKNISNIEKKIRYVFFEGGRDIPMSKIQREAMFREGLTGLLSTHKNAQQKGIWKYYDEIQQEKDIKNVMNSGSMKTDNIFGLDDFLGRENLSYDNQIGSIGGGNHFVEIQKISKILDPKTAYSWGLHQDKLIVMIHTGSLSLGHITGSYFKELLKKIYPKNLKHPNNGIYVLPDSEKFKEENELFKISLANSSNFAYANRLFLGLMIKKVINEEVGDSDYQLLYDASHNLVWKENIDGQDFYLHRKGACSARGCQQMKGTDFEFFGEPVFIPGSMGSKSYIMVGAGNRNNLFSASHGAGRGLSRGQALKHSDLEFQKFIEKFKIITPIDPNSHAIKSRKDILKKWEEELKKEAPYAYKDISPIIQTHIDNDMARPVVELEPILTVKG